MKKQILKSNAPELAGSSHRYETEEGEISLIYPCYASMGAYEIYCVRGELFDDIERFETLEEAEARIRELLEPADA